MIFRRLLYIPYYFVKTDWKLFFKYCRYVKVEKGLSYFTIIGEVMRTMYKHNASPLDYFHLRFFDLSEEERSEFPCTGFMYEYQLKMNPIQEREVLHDKIRFLERFDDFSGRKWATFTRLKTDREFAVEFCKRAGKKLVLKKSKGGAGKDVDVIEIPAGAPESVTSIMEKEGYDLAEHYVIQHNEMMRLSPAAVNTIRIVTQYTEEGEVVILLAFVRISVNSQVDNLSVGHYGVNIGAAIDLATGRICQPGRYLDVTKTEVQVHPVTGTPIEGFTIPFWPACKEIVINAAKLLPGNRSIGWDVAISNNGPVLIEGNHNWNLLSMAVGRKGYKKLFMQYMHRNVTEEVGI
ncbi:MAG TPA: sugar-transfer associated ATP-grasp domain-containing protein [Agriterribacter sp.]|nr:hypothetical protein [Chitinophagaceae bacterium]HRP31145.1 sugar-transfer associated ATP-grasp domain-containing protein [Agriterribacter sp.]